MVERITKGDRLIAVYVPAAHHGTGVRFVTDEDATMQLGILNHPKAHRIAAHVHLPVPRRAETTQEVLFMRRGRMRVDLYDENDAYLESRVLETGDVILLVSGGHGFEVLEDAEIVEAKTGPYLAEGDKRLLRPRTRAPAKLAD